MLEQQAEGRRAMRCLVTGATGFVGNNLVRELIAQGHQVKGVVRSQERGSLLADLECEQVVADLRDPVALKRAAQGCDWCFHVGASYHLWLPDYKPMYAINVDGTRNVLRAALDAGCERIVYTSTVGCVGRPKRSRGRPEPTDETAEMRESELANPYKRSKWEAERIAREMAAQGMPIVIVNPSSPVGQHDVKPTPTGQMILDFLHGRMPAYLDTGLNWVYVRDVAVGHIRAAERGRIGERYILGHHAGNWTMKETLQVLGEITGRPAPRLKVPYLAALLAACAGEGLAYWTRRPPRAPLGAVRMARDKMFFTPAKAIRELELPQTPPRQAFEEAVAWFQNGPR